MRWANALIRSVIWLGGAALYAYLKKPAGVSVLDVRTDALGWFGTSLLGTGLALHCWSNVVLAGHDPARGQAATLAATGSFRFVRNPIYLAGIALLTGIGLLYRPWHINDLILPFVLFVYFHLAIVRVEEPALRRLFGASYDAYCQRVPRWLPRLARPATVVTLLSLSLTSCYLRDGLLIADGVVVDAQGQPVSGATVTARDGPVLSDVRGCFQVVKTTYPDKHRMPFTVEATGFKPFTGTIDSPGHIRVRVAMAGIVSRESPVVDSAPAPGALGACEPPSRESTAR